MQVLRILPNKEEPEIKAANEEPIVTFGQLVFRRFLRSKTSLVGVGIIVIMTLFCFVGAFINPYNEYEQFFDPDVSFTKAELEELVDEGLISEDVQAGVTEKVLISKVLNYYKEVILDPLPLKEALAMDDGTGDMVYKLYHVSFRLAEKNRIIKLGYATNQDIQLYNRQPPTSDHLLGTDRDGYDIFTRLQYGGRISLLIGIVCVIFALLIGVGLGGISGYYGRWLDAIIMRIVDVVNSIPTFPIIIMINGVMRAVGVDERMKIYYLIFIIAVLSWTGIARLVRGQILSLREQEYMLATEAAGLSDTRRIFRHLLPNVMPQIIVSATLLVGEVILLESALSFLGLGVSPPFSTWGIMVNSVSDAIVMLDCPWVWIPPGLCILLTVMAINFVGDGLRDAFDPKMKR